MHASKCSISLSQGRRNRKGSNVCHVKKKIFSRTTPLDPCIALLMTSWRLMSFTLAWLHLCKKSSTDATWSMNCSSSLLLLWLPYKNWFSKEVGKLSLFEAETNFNKDNLVSLCLPWNILSASLKTIVLLLVPLFWSHQLWNPWCNTQLQTSFFKLRNNFMNPILDFMHITHTIWGG